MVHVRKCSLGQRGYPSTEFEIGGKPYIYCQGWVDSENDELLEACKECADHVSRAQSDFERSKQ